MRPATELSVEAFDAETARLRRAMEMQSEPAADIAEMVRERQAVRAEMVMEIFGHAAAD